MLGLLNARSQRREDFADLLAAVRVGLADTGFAEDRNIRIESRWANDHYDRLPLIVLPHDGNTHAGPVSKTYEDHDFVKGIVGSAVACPLSARAQQPAMPVVGFLSARSRSSGRGKLPAV
jgi:hypothetical protein